ncbi:uncharacterized protein PRCAT00001576001 [Priceomyces carsonii]|uniref:uncharacterized protein n=1 Tax=Priceomyces carsonii TaxID=28549 RepID=UPI002EDAD53C|nr:unnamed protein product [Priceomyces carsonii]
MLAICTTVSINCDDKKIRLQLSRSSCVCRERTARMSHTSHLVKGGSSTVFVNENIIGAFRPVKTFNYHQEASITSLDFDDSGQYLISSGVDKSIQLYDVHKGIHYKDIQSQKYGAHVARFTHQGLNCLYASTPSAQLDVDNAVRYLSLDNNQYIRYFKGHKGQVTSIEVNPLLDVFLSSSVDRSVKMWDLKSSNPIGNLDVGQISVIAFDAQGLVFAVGKNPDPKGLTKYGTISLYGMNNFDKGPFLSTEIEILPGQTWNKIEFSNNGKLLLVSTDSPEHYIVDAFLGKLLTILRMDHIQDPYNVPWMSFKYPYNGPACFSTCGKFVFAGSLMLNLSTFDLTGIKTTDGGNHVVTPTDNPKYSDPFKVIETQQGIPKVVAFNPKLLTLATADNTVSLWQPKLH